MNDSWRTPERLVLSIFPGIDLLGRAFEEEGFCVVRGPDVLWGGDIRGFHPPAGVFGGVIGGPPCQPWSRLQFLNPNAGKGMQWVVNEFARVVEEARPRWFLMENVPYAPMPLVQGYHIYDVLLADEQVGGEQPRQRRFSFGTPDNRMLYVVYHEQRGNRQGQSILADARRIPVRIGGSGKEKRSILSSGAGSHGGGRREGRQGGRLPGRNKSSIMAGHGPVDRGANTEPYQNPSIGEACEAMGLPRDFTRDMPFTMQGKRSVIGNAVPMAMARAVAQAVKRAMPMEGSA